MNFSPPSVVKLPRGGGGEQLENTARNRKLLSSVFETVLSDTVFLFCQLPQVVTFEKLVFPEACAKALLEGILTIYTNTILGFSD